LKIKVFFHFQEIKRNTQNVLKTPNFSYVPSLEAHLLQIITNYYYGEEK